MYFKYNEVPGVLFEYENDYALAQWVSADWRYQAGGVEIMQARYNTSNELKSFYPNKLWPNFGHCLPTNNGKVFNLVVCRNYWETPSYKSVREALQALVVAAETHGVTKIALPRIKGLDWQKVHDIIFEVCNVDWLEIKVVYEEEFLKGTIVDSDIDKFNYGKDRQNIDGNTRYKYY